MESVATVEIQTLLLLIWLVILCGSIIFYLGYNGNFVQYLLL